MVQFLLSALNWKDILWSRHSECCFNLNLLICIRTECCFKRACFLCGYLRSVLLRAWPNRTNGIDGMAGSWLRYQWVMSGSEACILYELKGDESGNFTVAFEEWLSHVTAEVQLSASSQAEEMRNVILDAIHARRVKGLFSQMSKLKLFLIPLGT